MSTPSEEVVTGELPHPTCPECGCPTRPTDDADVCDACHVLVIRDVSEAQGGYLLPASEQFINPL